MVEVNEYVKYPRRLIRKERCCALSSSGDRCRKTAVIEDSYHGDGEIYNRGTLDEDLSWVRVAVCEEHAKMIE